MASVLLLYYHLLDERGIFNDQTVYVGSLDFNGFDFLDVKVKEEYNESLDINESLIREGAIIYLLCELNDVIGEFDDDFHSQPHTKKLIAALEKYSGPTIPEVSQLLKLLSVSEQELDYSTYNVILQGVYKKYVHGFFVKKLT